MTVLGPLTTTFKAPSTCTASTPQIYQIWTGSESRYEQGPLFTPGSDCFPSAYDASPQNYYSPGFCPHGYTAACSSTDTVQTRAAEETVLVCCPTALIYTCLDPSSTASWGCTTALANAHANIGVTVVRDGITSGYTVVSETSAAFAAHSIQVRFASDDLPQPTTDTTLPPAALPKTTIPTTLPTSDLLSSPPSTFSTPAAVGIGIGSALLFVSLIGAIAFILLRRRRSRKPPTPEDYTNRPFTPPPVPPKDPYRLSTYTHHSAVAVPATGGVYELSTPTAAAFPHRMSHHAGPFYHLDDEDDDKSTRTLTMGMGPRPGSAVGIGVGGGRSRTNTVGTARSEEATARVRMGEGVGRFPSELAENAKVHVAELEGGSGVVAELEGEGSGVGLGIQRPQSLVPPPPIGGGGGRPVSVASSSAGWTVMRREGVQATPWL